MGVTPWKVLCVVINAVCILKRSLWRKKKWTCDSKKRWCFLPTLWQVVSRVGDCSQFKTSIQVLAWGQCIYVSACQICLRLTHVVIGCWRKCVRERWKGCYFVVCFEHVNLSYHQADTHFFYNGFFCPWQLKVMLASIVCQCKLAFLVLVCYRSVSIESLYWIDYI